MKFIQPNGLEEKDVRGDGYHHHRLQIAVASHNSVWRLSYVCPFVEYVLGTDTNAIHDARIVTRHSILAPT